MNNSARREFDDEEGVDLPEEQVEHWEKVTGPDHLGVILEEGWPILTMGGVGACQAAGREVFLMGALHLHVPTRQGKTWGSGGLGLAPGLFSGDSRPRWSPRCNRAAGSPFLAAPGVMKGEAVCHVDGSSGLEWPAAGRNSSWGDGSAYPAALLRQKPALWPRHLTPRTCQDPLC